MKENESIESIVAEMRRREKSRYYPKVARNIMHQYADRIEAAWKREREELDKRISDLEAYAKLWTGRADELRLKCDEFYAKAKPIGNAAAMREALMGLIDGMCFHCDLSEDCKGAPCEKMQKAKAALSAPPRQCDVGTAEEQERRFRKYCVTEECNRYRCGHGCKAVCIDRCAVAWSQMTYESEEGGAK